MLGLRKRRIIPTSCARCLCNVCETMNETMIVEMYPCHIQKPESSSLSLALKPHHSQGDNSEGCHMRVRGAKECGQRMRSGMRECGVEVSSERACHSWYMRYTRTATPKESDVPTTCTTTPRSSQSSVTSSLCMIECCPV